MKMKQPIYTEIIFKNVDYDNVLKLLNKYNVGRVPLFSLIDLFDKEKIELLIHNIKMIMMEKKIHPFFPYPFYIITTQELDDDFLPVLNEKSELPSFFKQKLKRLRKKETITLQKSSIIVEKINNFNIPDKHNELIQRIKESKKLYKKAREIYFYQKIESNL